MLPTPIHEQLEALEQKLGILLPNLRQASQDAVGAVKAAKSACTDYLYQHGALLQGKTTEDQELGLVAFGSLGRQELAKVESDFDHAIVAYGAIERPEDIQHYRLAALKAQSELGLAEPGRSRLFGGIISASDLVNNVGLEEDTNRSHTQRMLFLEESVPILDGNHHAKTVRAILRRYLVDYRPHGPLQKRGVPRFLLNDVVRYWRTIAVDYQAKRWDELSVPYGFAAPVESIDKPKWGLRYIKLRSSRKLAFVGTLTSLFMPRITDSVLDAEVLFDQFRMPPLARLAQLVNHLQDPDLERLRGIFVLADEFAARLNDREFRAAVADVEHPRDPGDKPVFVQARDKTQDLQELLEALFCSRTPLTNTNAPPIQGVMEPLCLRQLTSRYMLF